MLEKPRFFLSCGHRQQLEAKARLGLWGPAHTPQQQLGLVHRLKQEAESVVSVPAGVVGAE